MMEGWKRDEMTFGIFFITWRCRITETLVRPDSNNIQFD